jgi:hypothetical protein
MSITPEQEVEIEKFISDESTLRWTLIRELVPQEQYQVFQELATETQACNHGVSQEEMEEMLHGPPEHPHESIFGGEHALLFVSLCLPWINAQLAFLIPYLHKSICEDFQYCRRRKEKQLEGEAVALAVTIADALFAAQTKIPVPVIAVSAYIAKSQLLDKWCRCNELLPKG